MAASYIALVANRASGSGTDPDDIAARLEGHGAKVERFEPDDCDSAAASGAERLVVAGGDGSIGPAAAAAGSAGLSLAVIPIGTANDFARAMDLPRDLDEACRLAAQGDELRALELGRFGERPFVNVANAGLAVPAARAAARWKKRLGPLAYALGAARAGVSAHPLECRVVVDGEALVDGRVWQLTIGCTAAFGGGARVETADPGDGDLEIAVMEAGARRRLVGYASALRAGKVTRRRDVRQARGGRVEVEMAGEGGWNVDGELMEQGSARFSAEHDAYRLVVG